MDDDRASLVQDYWAGVRLRRSSDRTDRLAAEEHGAEAIVTSIVAAGGGPALELIDDLLRAPDADPADIGAGVLEDLLSGHGKAIASEVAGRARRDPLWRLALTSCWLDADAARRVPELAAFLPSALNIS